MSRRYLFRFLRRTRLLSRLSRNLTFSAALYFKGGSVWLSSPRSVLPRGRLDRPACVAYTQCFTGIRDKCSDWPCRAARNWLLGDHERNRDLVGNGRSIHRRSGDDCDARHPRWRAQSKRCGRAAARTAAVMGSAIGATRVAPAARSTQLSSTLNRAPNQHLCCPARRGSLLPFPRFPVKPVCSS